MVFSPFYVFTYQMLKHKQRIVNVKKIVDNAYLWNYSYYIKYFVIT